MFGALRWSTLVSVLLVYGALAATVGVLVGRMWGAIHGGAWRFVHGPDRTPRASALLASGIAVEAALLAAAAAEWLSDAWAVVVPIGLAGAAIGAWSALCEWQPVPDPVPARPRGAIDLHDGLVFSIASRPAGVSAVLTVLSLALPVPMVAVAWWWGRRSRATRVRLRGDELEVARGRRRTVVPLLFAPVEEATRWDGTPVIRVGEVEIPVGGGPPGEVAWALDRLLTATLEADPVGTPVPPDAISLLRKAR